MTRMSREDLMDSLFENFMANFDHDWNLNMFNGFCVWVDIEMRDFLNKYAESISCGDVFRKAAIYKTLRAVSDSIMDLAKESIKPHFTNADHRLSETEVDEFKTQFMSGLKKEFLAGVQKPQQA